MYAQKSKINRVIAPEGTHHAICVGLVEVGTVDSEWQGETKNLHKIRLTFELPDELHDFNGEEKPLVVSQEYTLSMGEKANLRKLVEGIIGVAFHDEEAESFNIEELLGKNCLLAIKHKESKTGNKYVIISSASPLMKSMKDKKPFNPIKVLTYEKWDAEYYSSLPDFLKDAMKATPEYQKMFGIPYPAEESDGIPF